MKRIIQSAAEEDILRQIEWYAEKDLPDVARRFRIAVVEAIQSLVACHLQVRRNISTIHVCSAYEPGRSKGLMSFVFTTFNNLN